MASGFKLSIPRPCNEKWQTFEQTPSGGFCNSCNKVVVDFTAMTDDEIIKYFEANTAHTCGRFLPGQIKTYTPPRLATVKPGITLLRAGLLSLLFIMLSKPSFAQHKAAKADTVMVEEREPGLTKEKHSLKFTGVVKDEVGQALPGVSIWQKGTTNGTVTDADENFEFATPLKAGDVLVFSFVGYNTKEIKLKPGDEKGFRLPLQLCMDAAIMGEVATHQLYEEPTSTLQRFMARIGKLF